MTVRVSDAYQVRRANDLGADVDRVFRLAFDLGCKGITVYREGSRACQPMSRAAASEPPETGATGAACPRCGVRLGKVAGCYLCENCGFASCEAPR